MSRRRPHFRASLVGALALAMLAGVSAASLGRAQDVEGGAETAAPRSPVDAPRATSEPDAPRATDDGEPRAPAEPRTQAEPRTPDDRAGPEAAPSEPAQPRTQADPATQAEPATQAQPRTQAEPAPQVEGGDARTPRGLGEGPPRDREGGFPRPPRGLLDAGVAVPVGALVDAGAPSEAGVPSDAGVPGDGGELGEGGVAADAGLAIAPDAGPPDAGFPLIVPDAPPIDQTPAVIPSITGEGDGSRVIRTLLGLVVLLALAWIGAHPRVQKFEERLGISQVVTSGLPFVALGVLARAPGVDILTDEVLIAITPLLQFGLGWIGFHTGFQFEGAAMDEVPKGTSSVVILLTGASFAAIAVACGLVLFAVGLGGDPFSFRTLARDAAIVGLAGALSAPTLERLGAQRISSRAMELARTIGVLDDVVGVVALAMLFAWLHPADGSSWELPGVGWLFVTFGMAATLGLVMYAVLRGTESAAESSALLLGSVCFTAGMAGFFSLPPLVVCFLAGILLKNMPGGDKPRLSAAFARLERPIYLVFLVVVGALWRMDDWRGWLLLPVFVAARIAGRSLGARVARRLPADSRHPGLDEMPTPDLITPPMGALALAFVITARTLYESPATQAIVTAVIGGAVATEIIVQVTSRRRQRPAAASATRSSAEMSSPGTRDSLNPGRTSTPAAPAPAATTETSATSETAAAETAAAETAATETAAAETAAAETAATETAATETAATETVATEAPTQVAAASETAPSTDAPSSSEPRREPDGEA